MVHALILPVGILKHTHVCEFKASLAYIANSKIVRAIYRDTVSKAPPPPILTNKIEIYISCLLAQNTWSTLESIPSTTWWHVPAVLEFWKQRQED